MSDCKGSRCLPIIPRRSILKLALGGVAAGVLSPPIVLGQGDPATMPPQEGDLLVKMVDAGARPLAAADIAPGAPPVSAWPMDPSSKVVRKGNRLNAVLLIRFDPPLAGATAAGVVAFSGLCTHAGCDVNQWVPETGIMTCDCHQSEFDAKDGGKVVGGPASRALPPLSLTLNGDTLVVAKPFAAAIRFDE